MNTHRIAVLATSIAALFTIAPARAVNVFWDTNGAIPGSSAGVTANGTWDASAVGNWSTDLLGAVGTTSYATANGGVPSAADVVFSAGGNATGASTITITAIANAGVVANGITIEDGSISTATSGTFSAGPVLTLGAGGLTIAASAAGPSSFNSNTTVALSANQTWTNSSAALFTASGALTGTATTGNTRAFTLAPTAAGGITLGGVVGNGVLGGNLALVAGGAGTTTLSGSNVFSGGVTINAGATLTATGSNALGSNAVGAPVVMNHGTLNLAVANVTFSGIANGMSGGGVANVTVGSSSNTTTLNGNFSGFTGVWNIGVGAGAGGGKVQMNNADNAAATINVLPHATVYVSGSVFTQPHYAALVLNGGDTGETNGQLRLDANATWAGPITLAGDLTTPTVDSTIGSGGGSGFVTGAIGETGGPRALVKGGPGFITLSGANTFTGKTSVISGQLIVGSLNRVVGGTASSHLGAPTTVANGTIDLGTGSSTGQLVYTGAGETTDRVVNLAGTTGSGTLTQSGVSGNLKFTSDFTATGVGAKLLLLQGTTAGTGEIAGAIVNGAGTTSLLKFGTGTWTLSGANTFTGTTSLSGGTVRLDYSTSDTSKLADAAVLTFTGGALELAGGTHAEIVASTTLTLGTNNTITRTSGAAVIALNSIAPGAGATLVFNASGATTTDNLNTNGLLGFWARTSIGGVSSWAANATNAADGAVVPYAGYTDITRLGASTIPNGAANNVRIINGGVAGNIALAGGAQAYTLQMDASDGAATVAPSTATDVLNIGDNTGGAIWQTATSGALTLGISPNDGVLTSGATANATPATLQLINDHTTNALTIHSAIKNNGSDVVSVVKAGPGTAILNGSNTYGGTLTIGSGNSNAGGGGMLILTGNNSAATGSVFLGSGATLQLQNANALGTIGSQSGSRFTFSSGSTLQLRADAPTTFAGADSMTGLGNSTVIIDVNRLTTGTGSALALATGGFNVGGSSTFGTIINVTGGNGYSLSLGTLTNTTTVANSSVTLTPTTAALTIAGYTGTTAFTSTLTLNGTATGNLVTGPITNTTGGPPALVSVTKFGTGAWESAGANTFTGTMSVREGTLTLSGNRTVAAGAINVADATNFNATLNITNGNFATSGLTLSTTTNVGTVNHSGGTITASSGNFVVVGSGINSGALGIYNLSGGTLAAAASALRGVTIGMNTGATGIFTLSGTGSLSLPTSVLMVARSDDPLTNSTTGTFNQTGGTANVGTLSIGGGNAGTTGHAGTVNFTGGTFTAANFTTLAGSPTSTATITIGGTAQVTLPAFPTARGGGSTATLTFDGGTLIPAAASTAYLSGLTNAFIKNGGGKIDVPAGRDINITQALANFPTHTGALTKLGAGALRLAGTQTYSILNANEGTTNLKSALGTGGSTLNANAIVNIGADQTLAALNIGDGAVVTLNSALAAPTPDAAFDEEFGAGTAGSSVPAVPEPGSAALFLGGMLTLVAATPRRRK